MKSCILLIGVLAACTSDPVDAEGTYTVSVTNRENGCNFDPWTAGANATNITAVINQEGENAGAEITGVTGAYLDLILGSHVFNGKVDGDALDLTILGTRSGTTGNCTFTLDARLRATLDGDVLTGRIDYSKHGNGNPDCAPINGCVTYQDMNGTRPPQ